MSYRSKMTRRNDSLPLTRSRQEKQTDIPKVVASANHSTELRELQDLRNKRKKTRLSGDQEMPAITISSPNDRSQARVHPPPLPMQKKAAIKFVPPFSNRTRNSTTKPSYPSNIDFPLHLNPSTFRLSGTAKNPMRSQLMEVSETLNERVPLSSRTSSLSRELLQNLPEEGNVVEDDESEDNMGEDGVGEDDVDGNDVTKDVVTEDDADPSKSKPKRARTMKTLDWTSPQNIDEKEDVITIDSENNKKILRGTIRLLDIDSFEDGVRLVVIFSDLNQPLRRGGDALVSYLGYLAKIEKLCPIGVLNWRKLDRIYKDAIVTKVRGKFVIPLGELFDKAILGRVNKHWKHYKYTLKSTKFKPETKTRVQIIADAPYGIPSSSWMSLVDYWYTNKSKNLSSLGKVARTAQSHVHTTGRKSYANMHADIVESTGKSPSQLDFFKLTHTKTGGGFVKNTSSSQFLEEANSKVDELVNSSSSKSREEIENDVFQELMYDGDPKRPVGYGFGVRKSQVIGVHAMLRTKGHNSASITNNSAEIELVNARMSVVNEENQGIRKENQELRTMVSQSMKILSQTIEAFRTGNLSPEYCDSLQSALSMSNFEDTSNSAANGNGDRI